MKAPDPHHTVESTLAFALQLTGRQLSQFLDSYLLKAFDNTFTLAQENYIISLTKKGALELSLSENIVEVILPLEVKLKRKKLFFGIGISSQLVLHCRTEYTIDQDWKLITRTELINIEWRKNPRLLTRFFSLSLKWSSGIIESQLKSKLGSLIDAQISQRLNLKFLVRKMLLQSERIAAEFPIFNHYLDINVLKICMAPISQSADHLESIVSAKAIMELRNKLEPKSGNPRLPKFLSKDRKEKLSSIIIPISLSDTLIEAWLNTEYSGQTISVKGFDLVIQSYKIFFRDGRITLELGFEGSAEGIIKLAIRAEYVDAIRRIEIKKMDIQVESRNIILKSALFLLKSHLKHQITSILQRDFSEYRDEAMTFCNQFLSEQFLPFGLEPKVEISQLQLIQLSLTEGMCYFKTGVSLTAELKLINAEQLLVQVLD